MRPTITALVLFLGLPALFPLRADCPPHERWHYWVRVESCGSAHQRAASAVERLDAETRRWLELERNGTAAYLKRLLETPGHVVTGEFLRARRLEGPSPEDGQTEFDLAAERRTVFVQTEQSCDQASLQRGQVVLLELLPSCCDLHPPTDLECLLQLDRLLVLSDVHHGDEVPPNPSLQRTTHGRSPVCGR